jgi:hypothetical protein
MQCADGSPGAIDFVLAQHHWEVDEVDGCIAFVEEKGLRWGASVCDTVEVLYECFWSAGMQVLLCVDGGGREVGWAAGAS